VTVKVGDVMQRRFDRLDPAASVLEASHVMLLTGHEALPVMEGDRLAGMVAERDILDRLLRELSGDVYAWGPGSVDLEDEEAFRCVATVSVAELMSRHVVTTTPDTPVLRAAATMRARRVRRLPVVEGERVLGLVFQADVLEAMVRSIPPATRRTMRERTSANQS
jgi:CBS domain-containing protein